MKRLSIIIPMYNVAPYVKRCLASLERQDIKQSEYEIICINDGSPDNSRDEVIKMQQEYSNIILIDQENSGVSVARNHGMEKAQGRYLLFIDPDDFVEENTFNRVLHQAEAADLEVLFLGYCILDLEEHSAQEVFNQTDSGKVFSGLQAYYIARGNGKNDPDRMWAILFRNDLLKSNHLEYLKDVPFLEDGEFIARILCLAKRCAFEGRSFYQRTTRPGSATHSGLFYSRAAVHGFILAARNLQLFKNQETLTKEQNCFINQPVCKFVILAITSGIQKPYKLTYKSIRDELNAAGFSRIALKGVVRPYNRMALLYNYFPVFFLLRAYFRFARQSVKKILKPVESHV